MGFEYEVDIEVVGKASTVLSDHALDMTSLASQISGGTAPKAGVCGEAIGPAFTAMTSAWKESFSKLTGEMTGLSKAVDGSAKMYYETEREVTRGFGKFAS